MEQPPAESPELGPLMRQTATEDAWYAAYAEAYDTVPAEITTPCPNCGHRTLHLVFTGWPDQRVGYASFWCSTCWYGLHLSRTSVPPHVDMLPLHLAPEERRKHVPNYYLIPPTPTQGELLEE